MQSNQSCIANTQGTAYTTPGYGGYYTDYSGNTAGYGSGQTWEAYDKFTLYFDKAGYLVKWDGYVQR